MRAGTFIVLTLLALAVPAVAQGRRDVLPTSEQLHQLYKQGQYRPLLQKLNRVLALEGDPAKPYDRYGLLTLQAETLLRLRSAQQAIDAFTAAADEAHDSLEAAVAKASARLIESSPGLQYTPEVSANEQEAQPIDVVDPKSRKDAFAALYDDEVAALQEDLDAAMQAQTLPPVRLARQLDELRPLEIAAASKDTQTAEILQNLTDHGWQTVSGRLDQIAAEVDRIAKHAAEQPSASERQRTDRRGAAKNVLAQRGLSPADVASLRQLLEYCQEAGPKLEELSSAAHAKDPGIGRLTMYAAAQQRRIDLLIGTSYPTATAPSVVQGKSEWKQR